MPVELPAVADDMLAKLKRPGGAGENGLQLRLAFEKWPSGSVPAVQVK